jgi:hypothetical protein
MLSRDHARHGIRAETLAPELQARSIVGGGRGQLDGRRTRERVCPKVHVFACVLNARERFIFQNRSRADAPERLTLAQIGKVFHVSRERAPQLESTVEEKLRKRRSALEGQLAFEPAA